MTAYLVEYTPNENEGPQADEVGPMDFVKLVQASPESNVTYDHETDTFTFEDECGVYYG